MADAVIEIRPDDPLPVYEQMRRQLAGFITARILGPGDRLPPVRALAADLGVAPGTVARVYRQLESSGWVLTRRGGGTIVADKIPVTPRKSELRRLTAEYVAAAHAAGFTATAIRSAVESATA